MWTERKLQNKAAKILKLLEPKARGANLDIFLLPHAAMKNLKARFFKSGTRDKGQGTRMGEPNVLSFRAVADFPRPEKGRVPGKKYLGEIYLNKNILKKSPERATLLLLHGILHLLGHDHEKKTEAMEMENLEQKILKALK